MFISDAAIFAHSVLRAAVLSLTLVRAELLIRLSRVAFKSSVKVYHEYVAFFSRRNWKNDLDLKTSFCVQMMPNDDECVSKATTVVLCTD